MKTFSRARTLASTSLSIAALFLQIAFSTQEALAGAKPDCRTQSRALLAAEQAVKRSSVSLQPTLRAIERAQARRIKLLASISTLESRQAAQEANYKRLTDALTIKCETKPSACRQKQTLSAQLKRILQSFAKSRQRIEKDIEVLDRKTEALQTKQSNIQSEIDRLTVVAAGKKAEYETCMAGDQPSQVCSSQQIPGSSTLTFDDLSPSTSMKCGASSSSCEFPFSIISSGINGTAACERASAMLMSSKAYGAGIKVNAAVILSATPAAPVRSAEILIHEPAFRGVCYFCGMVLFVNGTAHQQMESSFMFFDGKTIGGASIAVTRVGEPFDSVGDIKRRTVKITVSGDIHEIGVTGDTAIVDSVRFTQ